MNKELKTFAIKIVKKAGELTLSRFGSLKKSEVHIKSDRSKVTDIDLAVNKYLFDEIQKKYPAHGIVSEELPAKHGSKTFWVIDPIDGTNNYTMKSKIYSVTLALIENNIIVFGIIFFPALKEFYLVEKGKGVTLNGKRLKKQNSSRNIPLFIGYSKYHQQMEKELKMGVIDLKQPYRCATRDLVEVTLGAVDGVIYYDINLWDYAAGVLMVEEMGGKVLNFKKKPYNIESRDLIVLGRKK